MKNITFTIVMTFFILCSSVIFADAGTSSTSSIVTNSLTPNGAGNSNGNAAVQSTTYTTTTSTTVSSKDDDIVSAVYAKYVKDPALIGTALTVSSQNGIVTIDGTVTAQSQADEASIAAKSIAGVKDVRSSISVTTNPSLNKSVKTPNY
jgi:osmotically-inducible protein OsmY